LDVKKEFVDIKDFQTCYSKSGGNLVYKHIGKKEGYSRQVRKSGSVAEIFFLHFEAIISAFMYYFLADITG
jgi:hypothetical protein